MINVKRRIFLQGAISVGVVGFAASTGLLVPRKVLAAWSNGAFSATTVNAALSNLLNSDVLEASDKISIKAPDIAENGAVVPVSVNADMENVDSISILVDKNTTPLTASFALGPGTEAFVSTRIKMGKTGNVVAVVKAGDKLYSTQKEVKVTIGGCGG